MTNEVYKLYKVFDANGTDQTFDATGIAADTRSAAYTYTKNGTDDAFLTALQGTSSPFTLERIQTSDVYNVTLTSGKTTEDVITFLNAQCAAGNLTKVGDDHTATAKSEGSQEGQDIEIDGLDYGYYYINTTTGSAVTINSAANEVKVADKNSVPSIDKKQSKTASNYADADLAVNIGDTVYYQTTVTAGKTNDKIYTVTDTLDTGLTLDHTNDTITDLKVTDKDGTDIAVTNYTVSDVTDNKFVITFTADYVKPLSPTDTIVITYHAKVNSNAVVNTAIKNTVELKYSNQTTTDYVQVKTYDFGLIKEFDDKDGERVDASDGYSATFTLSDSDGNALYFTLDGTTYTKTTSTASPATSSFTINGDTTGVIFKGLAPGTYTLTETDTQSGFAKLTGSITVTIADDGKVSFTDPNNKSTTGAAAVSAKITVKNTPGSLLPSTGGVGTTMFYVIGGIIVAAAAVLLISKRRKA